MVAAPSAKKALATEPIIMNTNQMEPIDNKSWPIAKASQVVKSTWCGKRDLATQSWLQMLKIHPFALVTTEDWGIQTRQEMESSSALRKKLAVIACAKFKSFRVFQGCSGNHSYTVSCTKPLARPFWL